MRVTETERRVPSAGRVASRVVPPRTWASVGPPAERLVPLSVPELRRLLNRLRAADHAAAAHALRWSRWRRRHPPMANACHAKRRRAALGEKWSR